MNSTPKKKISLVWTHSDLYQSISLEERTVVEISIPALSTFGAAGAYPSCQRAGGGVTLDMVANTKTDNYSHSQLWSIHLTHILWDYGRDPECAGKTRACTGRTCKLIWMELRFEPQTLLLWGNSANYATDCSTMQVLNPNGWAWPWVRPHYQA